MKFEEMCALIAKKHNPIINEETEDLELTETECKDKKEEEKDKNIICSDADEEITENEEIVEDGEDVEEVEETEDTIEECGDETVEECGDGTAEECSDEAGCEAGACVADLETEFINKFIELTELNCAKDCYDRITEKLNGLGKSTDSFAEILSAKKSQTEARIETLNSELAELKETISAEEKAKAEQAERKLAVVNLF
jgi:hypothetical protein